MGDPEAFLVLNADIIGDYPLIDFVEFHRKHSGEHSILATEARRIIFVYYWLLKIMHGDMPGFSVSHSKVFTFW